MIAVAMADDDKVVWIGVRNGMVVEVLGLPDGYLYEVVDHDAEEECGFSGKNACPRSCHGRPERRR